MDIGCKRYDSPTEKVKEGSEQSFLEVPSGLGTVKLPAMQSRTTNSRHMVVDAYKRKHRNTNPEINSESSESPKYQPKHAVQ